MGQTVNLLVYTFGGSNPSSPTKPRQNTDRGFILKSGSSSVGRASAFQAEGRGFEPRLPLPVVETLMLKGAEVAFGVTEGGHNSPIVPRIEKSVVSLFEKSVV